MVSSWNFNCHSGELTSAVSGKTKEIKFYPVTLAISLLDVYPKEILI